MSRYRNDQKTELHFELRGKQIPVKPGDELSIDERFDYAIGLMGVKLTRVDAPAKPEEAPKASGVEGGKANASGKKS